MNERRITTGFIGSVAILMATIVLSLGALTIASPAHAQGASPVEKQMDFIEKQFNIIHGDVGFGYGGGDPIPPRVQTLLENLRSNLRSLLGRIFGF